MPGGAGRGRAARHEAAPRQAAEPSRALLVAPTPPSWFCSFFHLTRLFFLQGRMLEMFPEPGMAGSGARMSVVPCFTPSSYVTTAGLRRGS